MADRILIKGGHVITVDPSLGDIAGGDVTVIVGGRVHKRRGTLVADWDRARAAVQASSEHLREALERKNATAKAQA